MRWILASGSPRRKELLGRLGIEFEILPAAGEEIACAQDPGEYARILALNKAEEVYEVLTQGRDPQEDICVIGADTVVAVGTDILGKPSGKEAAISMIKEIEGRGHLVMTGVSYIYSLVNGRRAKKSFFVTTKVHVADMTEDEIVRYVDTGEAYDKAGGYGIQGAFGLFIAGIEGDYYNVVGLPIAELYKRLKNEGLLF